MMSWALSVPRTGFIAGWVLESIRHSSGGWDKDDSRWRAHREAGRGSQADVTWSQENGCTVSGAAIFCPWGRVRGSSTIPATYKQPGPNALVACRTRPTTTQG